MVRTPTFATPYQPLKAEMVEGVEFTEPVRLKEKISARWDVRQADLAASHSPVAGPSDLRHND